MKKARREKREADNLVHDAGGPEMGGGTSTKNSKRSGSNVSRVNKAASSMEFSGDRKLGSMGADNRVSAHFATDARIARRIGLSGCIS